MSDQPPLFDLPPAVPVYRPNKQERLEALLEQWVGPDGDCYVEFIPRKGWYFRWIEVRYFGDEGEFLGSTYEDASAHIEYQIARDK